MFEYSIPHLVVQFGKECGLLGDMQLGVGF